MDIADILQRLGIAAALGMLIGLQRQRSGSALAGIRTFPLIAAFGALCALLAQPFGGWTVGAGLLALAGMLAIGNVQRDDAEPSPGVTTEIAALLMFALGAWIMHGPLTPAIVIAGGAALLLHLKKPMHAFAARIGREDWTAVMQFVLIALVILPILPDRTYGPYDVLNPHEIWFMVVLIVGISLAGYVAYKLFGKTAGTLLGGVLGGLISSTATTASFARRARGVPEAAPLAVLVATIASTVALGRVMTAVAVVAPSALTSIWPPLAALMGFMALVCLGLWFMTRRVQADMAQLGNPAQLKPALMFGALYAIVLLAVAATRARFGDQALYAVAVVSGLTDLDAITLSSARLVEGGKLAVDTAWRVIVVASLANLAFKAGMAWVLGGLALGWRISAVFGLCIVAGGALAWFWPDVTPALMPQAAPTSSP
ncbi:MAG: MgtC/SapB family protein [Planctomycetes bacterium]|nr:MgtC/SapB family protein [Planctomycetota bacterium]